MNNEVILYGVGGEMAGNIFRLDDNAINIGRSGGKCAIVFSENANGVSSVHCQVRASYPCLEVTDMGSTYGTYLENGVQMQANVAYKLQNNEIFYVGEKKNRFLVKIK